MKRLRVWGMEMMVVWKCLLLTGFQIIKYTAESRFFRSHYFSPLSIIKMSVYISTSCLTISRLVKVISCLCHGSIIFQEPLRRYHSKWLQCYINGSFSSLGYLFNMISFYRIHIGYFNSVFILSLADLILNSSATMLPGTKRYFLSVESFKILESLGNTWWISSNGDL